MSLSLGRASDLTVTGVASQAGDRVQFQGYFTAATIAERDARLAQIHGLLDNEDEEVVPLAWTVTPSADGYYKVISATASPWAHQDDLNVRWSATVERVANGWALPVLELVSTAAVRTNAVGVADAEPDAVIGWRFQTLPFYDLDNGLTQIERFSDGPDNVRVYLETAPWSATSQKVFITPSAFYGSGCLLEIQGTDNAWYAVIGRQAPPGMAGKWRISNGLVRFTASATNTGDLKVEVFDNDTGDWRAMTSELRYGIHTGGAFSDTGSSAVSGFARATDGTNAQWAEPYIIRNDRDTVIIGFRRARGAVQTFTLHAGDYFVEFFSHLESTVFLQAIQARSAWTSAALSATAPFSATPGIEESSNDANGNRLLLLYTDAAHTRYAASPSGLYQTAASADAAFGIGVAYAGSGAAAGNAALDIAEQWTVAKSWRTFTVAQ